MNDSDNAKPTAPTCASASTIANVYVSQLTPAGRGAIATVSIEGQRATSITDRLFQAVNRKPLGQQPINRIVFGNWALETNAPTSNKPTDDDAVAGEELVVCRRRDDYIEVHCHGGDAAVKHILNTLTQAGARLVDAANPCSPLLSARAEAQLALTQARTTLTASILLNQWRGALDQELAAIIQLIEDANCNAANLTLAADSLQQLLDRYAVGKHLTTPFKIVVAGEPNVGKSSLINRILGFERSIVFNQPGTTRDVVTASTAIHGWPVELRDTAGLRDTEAVVESKGITKAKLELRNANLVLLVADAAAESENTECVDVPTNVPTIQVRNKSDLLPPESESQSDAYYVSAVTGDGIEALLSEIALELVGDTNWQNLAMPISERQFNHLSNSLELLRSGKTSETTWTLRMLLD